MQIPLRLFRIGLKNTVQCPIIIGILKTWHLTRLYFVAFSRAKDVLLLVGLNPNIDGYKQNEKQMKIPNVALGWNRDEEFIGFDNIFLI